MLSDNKNCINLAVHKVFIFCYITAVNSLFIKSVLDIVHCLSFSWQFSGHYILCLVFMSTHSSSPLHSVLNPLATPTQMPFALVCVHRNTITSTLWRYKLYAKIVPSFQNFGDVLQFASKLKLPVVVFMPEITSHLYIQTTLLMRYQLID